jgi:hypothetical protein
MVTTMNDRHGYRVIGVMGVYGATAPVPPRAGKNLHDLKGNYRMDTETLNSASFEPGVTLSEIEKLTLSAADLDRLTFADLADLAPLRLLAP